MLKEEDYLDYSENFKLIETLIKGIFSTNMVVFIGYGLNDYNVKLILNWAKNLLKDDFRKPIFYYTDNDKLKEEELRYQVSRGLDVIEYHNLIEETPDFTVRYKALFDAIDKVKPGKGADATGEKALDVLFRLLAPLEKLDAIRISDLNSVIGYDGVIISPNRVCRMYTDWEPLKQYFDLSVLSPDERNSFEGDVVKKYETITRVFRKAGIKFAVDNKNKPIQLFEEDVEFADENCISFDYLKMSSYVEKEYDSIEEQYRKAFYLYKLNRFDESLKEYDGVSKKAFEKGDYVKYYFSVLNCISLSKVVKRFNLIYGCYKIDESLDREFRKDEESLFYRMPVEFRNEYSYLRNVYDSALLYKLYYESGKERKKLEKTISKDTIEYGETSSMKVLFRIRDSINYLMQNGLVYEGFDEYKASVVGAMDSMIHRRFTKRKKEFFGGFELPEDNGDSDIAFDEVDFYCFIECFQDNDIRDTLEKYDVDTLTFNNSNKMESAVVNILNYYKDAVKKRPGIEVLQLQHKIRNILLLLAHADISQELVDSICEFIFAYDFREITIDEKALFLDYQVYHRNKYSKTTKKVIEDTLIEYLDRHIGAIEKNEPFDVISKRNYINYPNLVYYISPQKEQYRSNPLSSRVSRIIEHKLRPLYKDICRFYYNYLPETCKKKVWAWANAQLAESFDFMIFEMMVGPNTKIERKRIGQLCSFLDEQLVKKNYDELTLIGLWCYLGYLEKKDFFKYKGYCDEFDFLIDIDSFDFNRFNPLWLLRYRKQLLEMIAINYPVADKIRNKIAIRINSETTAESDKGRLKNVLVNYFCNSVN